MANRKQTPHDSTWSRWSRSVAPTFSKRASMRLPRLAATSCPSTPFKVNGCWSSLFQDMSLSVQGFWPNTAYHSNMCFQCPGILILLEYVCPNLLADAFPAWYKRIWVSAFWKPSQAQRPDRCDQYPCLSNSSSPSSLLHPSCPLMLRTDLAKIHERQRIIWIQKLNPSIEIRYSYSKIFKV